ncbi:MAG: helicase-exonuclease AddAB subunit AddA [Lachnospiraceae bacterium]|nr:helicase-exonuclease AddAB subunit AddA [Lachnospiraceae bacterium]
MANMTWTTEQQKVIDTRGRNLLVSAAAGSGKTAVLVERIIQMVTDPEHPVDIDRLLVMTFTNAAAAEMRERIGDALEKRLEEHPGDRNLERQTTLIHHAKITTIDSFCLRLLREHFNELDIDPGFRIGDESELLLLQADVMKELLEDYYGRNDERFFRFVDTYASGKSDGGLEDYIMQVFRFSQSNPWPKEWIAACRRELDVENFDGAGFENTAWMKYLVRDVRRQANEFAGQLYEALEIAEEEDGPQAYLPMLTEDQRIMERLSEADSYAKIYKILSGPLFGRLAAVRGKNVDPEKKELAAGIRNRVKDAVKKMKELYVPTDMEHMVADLLATNEPVAMLLELAEEFSDRYQKAKEEKNLVDFSDLEHFALEILTDGSQNHDPGPVADELSDYYEEILVDEYQDSNEVQETLIKAISRERFGTPNVFMVGDVKQSIYKFRLAKPELFLEKYESYQKEDGLYQKIELHKNFRSRAEVLGSINDVFYSIMTKPLGNIRYTDDAALYPGADYPEPPCEGQAKTEVYLLNTGEELLAAMDDDLADYTAKEAEARLIAAKIKEYTHPETGMKVWNRKTGQYEPLRKKDIVILLRSLSGWAEEFLSVLSAEGIPAFAESRTGYFNAVEIETVLNMLAIIDNPMQDIPLVGVLKSPIGGLTDRELAMVMAAFKQNADRGQDVGFYGAVRMYLEMIRTEIDGLVDAGQLESREVLEEDPGTAKALGRGFESRLAIFRKLHVFWELLADLRREAGYLPVHRLIYRIFERTGYYDYVSAMPAGNVRQANLNMLVEKAAAYERTSYQSLFDFIRYIEKLKKYNTDFGEAARVGENDDTVRIMSIHKSKGLEFPEVFLAGAGKMFNRQDARGKILIDEELGVATDYFDPELKVKASTLKKSVLSRRSNLESMGEELRILYVAMTRAKEKLIITAGDKNLESKLEKWGSLPASAQVGDGLPFTILSAANSYLEWILMASQNTKDSIEISRVPISELVAAEVKSREEKAGTYAMLKVLRESEGEPADFGALLQYRYPYEDDIALHAKMSVSELKHQGQFTDDAESDFLPTIPDFMRKSVRNDVTETEPADGIVVPKGVNALNGGTYRGTAYHRVLELIDFKSIHTRQDVFHELKRIREDGLMDEHALNLVWGDNIWTFFSSDIAARMKRADETGNLHKESQFVMGIPARLMDEADSDEPVLIQGIIDAWFEEDGEIILVDYKTDRVAEGEETILLDRYQIQMVYYAQALQQITEKKVRAAVIYSLTLQKEIFVDINL